MFPSTLVLDMRVPADRALGGSVMELLAYPTLRHAQSAADRSARWIAEARAEMRRVMCLRDDGTNRFFAVMHPPGWQWQVARQHCHAIRRLRRAHAADVARVARYSEMLSQEAA